MADSARVREVSWLELFPWLRIASAIKIAFSPSVLILAALGIVSTTAGWRAIGFVYSNSDDRGVRQILYTIPVEPDADVNSATSTPWMWSQSPVAGSVSWNNVTQVNQSPFFRPWGELVRFFAGLFSRDTSFVAFSLKLLLALWALVVWSLFGAGITRIAALNLARGDKLGFRPALAYGIRRWPSFLAATLIPLVAIFLLAIPPAILGLLMRADFFVLVGGLIWPLVLMVGLVMAILLVGLAFGWPLMWPTISVENTDPFDALSRAYSYTYHRPLRYLFYVIVAAILGFLAWVVVTLFANLIVDLSFWAVSWGAGVERTDAVYKLAVTSAAAGEWTMLSIGGALIRFWWSCINVMAHAFLFSYFWSAMTAIYYLLRKAEDGTETEEVAVEEQREAFGLPPLTRDSAGVPAVSDPASVPPVSTPPSFSPSSDTTAPSATTPTTIPPLPKQPPTI